MEEKEKDWVSRTLNFHCHYCLPISLLIAWRKESQRTSEGAGGGGCSLPHCLLTVLVFPAGRDLGRSIHPFFCPGRDSLHAEKETWPSQRHNSPSILGDKNINHSLFKSQQIFSEHFPCARHANPLSPKFISRGLSNKDQGRKQSSDTRIYMLKISLPDPTLTPPSAPHKARVLSAFSSLTGLGMIFICIDRLFQHIGAVWFVQQWETLKKITEPGMHLGD